MKVMPNKKMIKAFMWVCGIKNYVELGRVAKINYDVIINTMNHNYINIKTACRLAKTFNCRIEDVIIVNWSENE